MEPHSNGIARKVIKIYNHLLYKNLYGEVKDPKFHYINSSIQPDVQEVKMSVQENSTATTPPANPSNSGAPSDHTN